MQTESLAVARPNGSVFSVDMTEIRRLEARQAEASGCGRMEALALMLDMKEGYRESGEARAAIGMELDRAKVALKMRKAIVSLDIVPEELKRRGLTSAKNPSGSAEQREDVLMLDAEYQKLLQYIAQVEASYTLMKIKMDTFVMTHSSVKRTFDEQLPGMLPNHYNGGARWGEDKSAQRLPSVREIIPSIVPPSPQTAPTRAFVVDVPAEVPVNAEDFGIQIGKAKY
jgi:hypothetical protein